MNIFRVTESSENMRTLGRRAMETKRNTAMLAMLVYGVATMLPPAIITMLFAGTLGETMSLLYTILISGPFTFGLTFFFLAVFRRQQSEVQQVFIGFEQFGKTLGLFLYILLFTILWTLIFVIPGIIAGIRYSQAFFIMVDHPEYTVSQCVEESKARMGGNKGIYFILNLSFIGWALLCGIPTMIVSTLFMFSGSVVLVELLSLLAMIPYIWLGTYVFLTQAAFYEILVGNIKAAPMDSQLAAPQPIETETIETKVIQPKPTNEQLTSELPIDEETTDVKPPLE